ncbi:MAG: phage integrase family site specific recombinase [marine bacterium B5-7]|nr:MAG: phage integrase family site specific recombinase [marine bacterium B5-7]
MKKQLKPLFDSLDYLDREPTTAPYAYIDADDYRMAHHFLYCYRGSEATYNAYRREVERLLHWCGSVAHKNLTALRRADIEAFIYFCQRPLAHWIGLKNVARFVDRGGDRIPNPDWHPFVASVSKVAHQQGKTASADSFSLSQKALQAIFAITGSFYNFLIQEDYLEVNPVAQVRQKSKFIRKQQGKPMIRRLSNLQWDYVIETAELLAKENPAQHERTLFIMNALFSMYLRISELASSARWTPEMGDFARDQDGCWWFTTVGKGNKQRSIAVSDTMQAALTRYRTFLGFSALPAPGDTTPLVPKNRGHGPISSTRQIREIVQHCFDQAVTRMMKDGFKEDVTQLQAATVHWLRHTGISEDVKHRPREHVRDDAGHGSSAITDKYIDIEMRERHASAKKKRIKSD